MKKISIEDFNKILTDAKKMGYDLRMSDIFYALELQRIENKEVIYSVLFGKGSSQEDINFYNKSDKIKFLKTYINTNYPIFFSDGNGPSKRGKSKKSDIEHEDITFEENKAYMLKLKNETEKAIEKGEIEKKDGLKILADLSVKLNDKFAVAEKQEEQRVIVFSKYNDICPYCNHEVRRKTDEDMLAEIKEKYVLTPKQDYKDNNDE